MEFILKIKMKASAEKIYTTWLHSDGHSNMTGGQAVITNKVGTYFTAWDGYIKGQILELNPYSRILQSWRTTQFEDHEPDSLLEILLHDNDGLTELKLIHTNVPESGEHYIAGWNTSYFQPMISYFNYG